MGKAKETRLRGGFVNDVVKVGDTVRRSGGATRGFTHRLLRHLELHGFDGAPRFLGMDSQARESLSFIDGDVPLSATSAVRDVRALAQVARLVRGFHDVTAGTELAGEEEVVCHNDLSPKNTVYRDVGGHREPVAFIDWDIAAPGQRIHDVAHVCWQYIGLGPGIDPDDAAARITVVVEAYRLAEKDRLIETILWWQNRCRSGMIAAGAAGDTAMARLCESGVPERIRLAQEWTRTHAARLSPH